MTGATAQAPRGLRPHFRADRVYLGWQYAPRHPDPGPSPRRPTPPGQQQLNPGWVAAQRREDKALNRPVRLACGGALALAAALLAVWITGLLSPLIAGPGIAACLLGAAACGHAIWQGARTLNERIAAEQRRVELIRAEQERRLFASQEEHAQAFREWQVRHDAYQRQLQWYAVSLPAGVHRVDVAGGTLPGWSALVTTLGSARLSTGGEMTVIDLSGGAVAQDLVTRARQRGIGPLIWILPGDLPRLDLGTGLDAAAMADVLALVVDVIEEHGGTRGLACDSAILEGLIEQIGAPAGAGTGSGGPPGRARRVTVAEVTAALRALAQAGDEDLQRGLLDAGRLEAIGRMSGRGAERVVTERARALESQLRKLEALGTDPSRLPPDRLRVLATDPRAGIFGNRVLGTYVVGALSQMLHQGIQGGAAGGDQPWRHTVILAGAEKLRGDVLDRLCDACEKTGTGLVLGYRSIPAPVRGRIGRGNAAVAFMRLGNADDAKAAAEQIGTGHRFALSPLTATAGASVTDTPGDSYTSTYTSTVSAADPVPATPPASEATGNSAGRAVSGDEPPARTSGRSRELVIEPRELQQLPPSALIVSYAGIAGAPAAGGPRAADRQVVLADANPAILGLPTATVLGPGEAEHPEPAGGQGAIPPADEPVRPAAEATADGDDGAYPPPPGPDSPRPASPQPEPPPASSQPPAPPRPGPPSPAGDGEPPPNLGPPPERLDWRTPRRS